MVRFESTQFLWLFMILARDPLTSVRNASSVISCFRLANNHRVIFNFFCFLNPSSQGPPRCTFRENLPSFTQFTECRTDNVLDKIRDKCTNLQDCTVPSHWNGYVNSEPCIGTYKYLQVTYRCLSKSQEVSTEYKNCATVWVRRGWRNRSSRRGIRRTFIIQ